MRTCGVLLSCVAAVLVAGCGGGGGGNDSAPDPLAEFKNQPVNWGSCNQYFSGDDRGSALIAKLGDRVKCADIMAPLDYSKPDGLKITLSMLRVEAPESADTKPNLFFNPGGPGGDGQKYSLVFHSLLSQGNPESALGRKYREVADAYNFVGFSPRGVGASTVASCSGNELMYEVDGTKHGDDAENLRRLDDRARYTASNCAKNPLMPHIHTDATARDMDLMRHLLGDEKLHYHGTSYGTWLGLWYAGVFPDKVGPMILDSNLNFSKSFHEASVSYQMGQAQAYTGLMLPYIARHHAVFGLGTDADLIDQNLSNLRADVSQAMLDIGQNFRVEVAVVPDYVGTIKAALKANELLEQGHTLDQVEWEFDNEPPMSDSKFEQAYKKQAAQLIDRLRDYDSPDYDTRSEPFSLPPVAAVWQMVVCNDEPMLNYPLQYWVDKAFEMARAAPVLDNRLASQPCLYWQRKQDVQKPTMADLHDSKVLMVQTQYDVPTPVQGAMQTFDLLPAAAMVYIWGEGTHGVMVHQTECVDLTVMNFLLGSHPAQRKTICEGNPLPLDESVPSGDKPVSVAAKDHKPASPFTDPAQAQELLNQLREAVAL